MYLYTLITHKDYIRVLQLKLILGTTHALFQVKVIKIAETDFYIITSNKKKFGTTIESDLKETVTNKGRLLHLQ